MPFIETLTKSLSIIILAVSSGISATACVMPDSTADNIAADTVMTDRIRHTTLLSDTLYTLQPLAIDADKFSNTIYAQPYSISKSAHDWHHLWINTAALSGAFVGTLLVLECLPEDATSWNRAELQDVPLFERWNNHVIKKGPEWDHDKFYFNYILHPYAGAVYYMGARSCGFNAWQSLLYCTLVSTVGWEFGIEAFMERPSYQDIFITPIVGSVIGEGFYRLKRRIVANHYTLCGSSLLGNIVAFIIDPVNEVLGLFDGNPARQYSHAISISPVITPVSRGVTLSVAF